MNYLTSCNQRLTFRSASPKRSLPRAHGAYRSLDSILSQLDDPQTEAKALALVQASRETSTSGENAFSAFGALSARPAVPKRLWSIEELKLNGIRAELLLSPKDHSLTFVRNVTQGAAVAGLGGLALYSHGDMGQVLSAVVSLAFALVFDQVANQGGGEALLIDTFGRLLLPSYKSRVALHEAGHLLIAYLVGVLPRTYTLSSIDAFLRFRRLNIQAGTQFCDGAFMDEIQSGRLTSSSLDKYSCVALAGMVTEYLRFGQAEGGMGDVMQLDSMFRALNFTQLKADGEVRWAVLNIAAILKQYEALHLRLALAMEAGKSIGELAEMIDAEVQSAPSLTSS